MATLRDILASFAARFAAAGVDSPRLSAEVLLAYAMSTERRDLLKEILLHPEKPLDDDTVNRAETLAARREKGEPVAYITGVKEFYGRDFMVTPATLIPRPETETLVETAISFAQKVPPPQGPASFIDLGTGSGSIAVTVALELPSWQGTAVDISPEALHVAAHNAVSLGAANLVFALCDFLSPDLPKGPYGMVLANPPYVSEPEFRELSGEVSTFEPKRALVPDRENSDGLEYLLALLDIAESILTPGGLLLMEMGCSQGETLLSKALPSGTWRDCRVIPDLAGLPRVFHAIRS